LDSRNASALYLLAIAEKQLDNAGRSAELLQRVVAIEPRNIDAHYLLGQDLAKLGKESEAVAQWRQAVDLYPEHAEALYNLARHLGQTDPEASKQYQARFVELQKKAAHHRAGRYPRQLCARRRQRPGLEPGGRSTGGGRPNLWELPVKGRPAQRPRLNLLSFREPG
jgi:cytochrome c-type biogenesis protein CcmH/NrfG